MINVWVDDLRNPPEEGEWEWAQNFDEAIELFEYDKVANASLDRDLGFKMIEGAEPEDIFGYDVYVPGAPYDDEARSGEDVLRWIIENDAWPQISLAVHSANPAGAARMRDDIEGYGPYTYREAIDYGHAWGVIYTKE